MSDIKPLKYYNLEYQKGGEDIILSFPVDEHLPGAAGKVLLPPKGRVSEPCCNWMIVSPSRAG